MYTRLYKLPNLQEEQQQDTVHLTHILLYGTLPICSGMNRVRAYRSARETGYVAEDDVTNIDTSDGEENNIHTT